MASLRDTIARMLMGRPEHQFSGADEQYRKALMAAANPEQMKRLDEVQTELWRNDFQRQVPQSLQPTRIGRQNYDKAGGYYDDWAGQSNMPMVSQDTRFPTPFDVKTEEMSLGQPYARPAPADDSGPVFRGNRLFPLVEERR